MGPFRKWLIKVTDPNFENLSWLCWGVTVFVMGMLWWTFITGCNPVPEEASYALWIVLTAYVSPKEFIRWKGPKGHTSENLGHVFPLLWMLSWLVMIGWVFFSERNYDVLKGMTDTTLGVWLIFIVSNTSRKVHKYTKGNGDTPEEPKSPIEKLTEQQDSTLDHP